MPASGTSANVLLLQGPVGPFFRKLAAELRAVGCAVTKVNFNAGDSLFYRDSDTVRFREPMEQWPSFIRRLIGERGIDAVFLFGDCRRLHRQAIEACRELELPVWVFEEGYLRPDFVTMELGGVNGNSSIPKDPGFFVREVSKLPAATPAAPVGNVFARWAWYAVLNSLAVTLLGWRYPHYQHHRDISSWRQAYCWLRGSVRKLRFGWTERGLLELASGAWSGNYFFVPLQVHCDAQIEHSKYNSIEEFIEEVVCAFSAFAPKDCRLVLKHHPHDRAYRDYTNLLQQLAERYGCSERVVYVHDLHLPTLLKHSRGVVTMNSTVGASALYHGAPVKVMGRAVYDIPGLTDQGELATFLREPAAVDETLFHTYCRWLRSANQVNGSFYRDPDGVQVANACAARAMHGAAIRLALPATSCSAGPVENQGPRPEPAPGR